LQPQEPGRQESYAEMPITEAPPTPPQSEERVRLRRNLPQDPAELHLLIEDLEEDRQRSRWRESVWISVIIHLLLIMAIVLQPKLFPDLFSSKDKVVLVDTSRIQDQNVNFLDLPPDAQKVAPPKTNIISDKNRVAQARTPTLDRHTLEELQRARKPGPPGLQAIPAPPRSAQAAPQGQQAAAQPAQQQQQQQNSNTQAKLEPPPEAQPSPDRNVFSTAGSAGSAIQQAARAAASGRGAGGQYGIGPLSPNTNAQGAVDILSDTLGVDFGPYLARVLQEVRKNWYNLIPEEAMSPLFKQGKLAVQFYIAKDGSVQGLKVETPSGDVALDRAALGGITASNPFPPLPRQFSGPYLALRFRFYYNPDRGEIH
jgi:TonB family protein